jgi:transcriptional regulator with GAF, ATPase, and Fis domain
VRGAFTGANRDRRGAFELAHRGTLFLDEIGDMPMQSQTRLLRVLQEGRFRRVGDERTLDVDVRVIAATNRDLQTLAGQGRFREDLFYRLNVFPVRIPPLRERMEDVPELLLHFLDQRAAALGRGGFRVQSDVVERLARCPFPGNVRELANLAAALAVSARTDERITAEHLGRVWARQHPGQAPPWEGAPSAARHDLGAWTLQQARISRFNLVEAERRLRREQKRTGSRNAVPLAERSALAYYLQGEMLRALASHEGNVQAAAREIAGDEDLMPRVSARMAKLVEELRACGAGGNGDDALRRRFAKLPRGYMEALVEAARCVG